MRILIFLLGLAPFSGQAGVNVVTSIQPLYLITKSIMKGVSEPDLLIGPGDSVHHFAFKPSQIHRLNKADLVIWIDRDFESGFQRLPDIVNRNAMQIELRRALGLKQKDGHIWYSATLLLQIVDQIQSALARIDPPNTASYSLNAVQLSKLIDSWRRSTRALLADKKPAYLLDHNFFSHFEEDMGVKATAVLHDSNGQPPSIRELQLIQEQLTKTPAKCLLHNESSPSKLAQNIAQKFNLPIYSIKQDSTDIMRGLQYISSTLLKCR